MRNSRIATVAAVLIAGFLGCKERQVEETPVRVAAASDLTSAFEEMGRAFEAKTGEKVSFTFGSTGLLAKQLGEGAPFDMFAAANVSFVDDVIKAGACDSATKSPYARGRIVLWSRRGAIAPPTSLEDVADPRFTRIALANPEHAPYGKAAKEALTAAGIWDRVEPRIVYGENIRQTFQLAESGNVEVAIVALALVINDPSGEWKLVDENRHQPIDQSLVVCKNGASTAGGKKFAEYVNSTEGRALMRRHGFLLPGEAMVVAP